MPELLKPSYNINNVNNELQTSLGTHFDSFYKYSYSCQVVRLLDVHENSGPAFFGVYMYKRTTKESRDTSNTKQKYHFHKTSVLKLKNCNSVRNCKHPNNFGNKLRSSKQWQTLLKVINRDKNNLKQCLETVIDHCKLRTFNKYVSGHSSGIGDRRVASVKASKQDFFVHNFKCDILVSLFDVHVSSRKRSVIIRMQRSRSCPNVLSSSHNALRVASSFSEIQSAVDLVGSIPIVSLQSHNVSETSSTTLNDVCDMCMSVNSCNHEQFDNERADVEPVVRKTQHSRSKSDGIGILISPSNCDADGDLDTSLYKSLPTILPEPKKQEKKSIFEGSPFIVPTECFFPRPQPGQTLTSFLSSDFNISAELDRENAHFCVSEALIAAIEQMKCTKMLKFVEEEAESDEEIKKLAQRIRIRRREKIQEKAIRNRSLFADNKGDTTASTSASPISSHSSGTGSAESMDSDEDGVEDLELSDKTQSNLSSVKESGLSLSMASMYSDADLHKGTSYRQPSPVIDDKRIELNVSNAEAVALSLLGRFSEKQLPKASDLEWLVSEQDAPQRLLPLPDSWPVSPDEIDDGYGLEKTQLRGNLEWAPPRRQIIFIIHPDPKRKETILKQNYRCAGCGMKIERNYIKRFRYCDYLGKFFCQCCHANDFTYIPGRILWKWDFRKYYVSKFAYNLLDQMYCDPLFNVTDINSTLYQKVRQLALCREYRIQIFYLTNFIRTCRNTEQIKKELEGLSEHILYEPHVYSIKDLVQAKKGELSKSLSAIVNRCVNHVMKCILCQGKGFICEVCNNEKDIIFPFQLHKVFHCSSCGSCFHKRCYKAGACPKCNRIRERKRKLLEQKVASDDDL